MADEITTLPSVKQENNHTGSVNSLKDKRTESKTCFEQSLVWEVADDSEWLEPEVINTKSAGRRKVTLPEASTATKPRRLKPDHYNRHSWSTEDMKLPKQNMNRSGVLNSFMEPINRHTNQPSSTMMPSVSPRSRRAFTEPCLVSPLDDSNVTVQGKTFRENLRLIYRQNKEIKKLEYDNMASRQALQDAQDLIVDLKAKIEKRNKYIRERNAKEGDLARDVEALRRERDEKLLEYKLIVKTMNEAFAAKDKTMEETEMKRTQIESVYQDHLKENTVLMRKIEEREKQIKQLKEKTEKAMRWKANVRS